MTLCRRVVVSLGGAWLVALAIFVVGTFGWFGQERDPLSGVFLLPLGLPWNQMIRGTPDAIRPWLACAAPLLNIAILAWLCRRFGRGAT